MPVDNLIDDIRYHSPKGQAKRLLSMERHRIRGLVLLNTDGSLSAVGMREGQPVSIPTPKWTTNVEVYISGVKNTSRNKGKNKSHQPKGYRGGRGGKSGKTRGVRH